MKIESLPQQRVWGAYEPKLRVGWGVLILYKSTEDELKKKLAKWFKRVYDISEIKLRKEREESILGMNYSEWHLVAHEDLKLVLLSSLETDEIFSRSFMLVRFLAVPEALENSWPEFLSQAKALLFLAERGIPEIGVDLKFRRVISPNEKWEVEIPYGWKIVPLGTHGDGILAYSGRAKIVIDAVVEEITSIDSYIRNEIEIAKGSLPLIQKPVITKEKNTAEVYLLALHGADPYVHLTRFHVNPISSYAPDLQLLLTVKAEFPLRTLLDFNEILNRVVSSWKPRKMWLVEYLRLYDVSDDFRELASRYSQVLNELISKKF